MKGLVFREFLEMVEQEFGYETVDAIIEDSKIESNGIYTNVGTYHHSELFELIHQLSSKKNIPANQLLFEFGKYVFTVFFKAYPIFFENKKNTFDLLKEIEDKIHVEVLKLYPEAELPSFTIQPSPNNEMVMLYRSKRKMSDFAEGLMQGCLLHFNEKANIEKTFINEQGSEVLFKITMNA
jgi:hypothetical protein